MSYAADHADALAEITEAGAAVTFTRHSAGAHAPATGKFSTPATSTVTGKAVRVVGDPEQLRALELIESEAPTLLFAPDTYGELPQLLDEVTWGGVVDYRVRSVNPVAPDGTAIIARVVVSR